MPQSRSPEVFENTSDSLAQLIGAIGVVPSGFNMEWALPTRADITVILSAHSDNEVLCDHVRSVGMISFLKKALAGPLIHSAT